MRKLEEALEWTIFQSRWILAPPLCGLNRRASVALLQIFAGTCFLFSDNHFIIRE